VSASRVSSAQTTKATLPVDMVVAANNAFGFDFYQKLIAQPATAGKNVVFSPYSISTGFSMLLEGARGETAKQIATSLHLPTTGPSGEIDHRGLRDGITGLRDRLQSSLDEQFQFHSANSVWIDARFSPSNSFVSSLQQTFGINDPIAVDFADPRVTGTLNNWVSDKTGGRIKQILPDRIPRDTSIVLANAVYMKAAWLTRFAAAKTSPKTFRLDAARSVTV
jgi:serpin B